ncbi:hypothetical protein MUS1_10505 [Marinomonas ushuaiensis DSM 15871]|uniref:Uncharacterized protein n=1 Tax=Marinomonas ushuaiensis DSM 15871 TaxID=1122207 RepID=X7E7R4_9GAMM|nr:hypothetical protein [Marinomonas ushuaiensis]ETX11231.1 hypothetical protein MUS1_10505 [Marinomonas ushuaiensis DSM 15871]
MFILRGLIYLFAVAGIAQLVSLEGYRSLTLSEYSEHSLTEYMQDVMSFLSCMLFLYASRLDAKLKIASTLLAALLGMMFVRESDSLLDHYVFDGAWQSIVLLIFACVMIFLIGRFSKIYASLKEYSLEVSFGIFLAGFVTLLAFSRMMGRSSFWQAVMGDSYMRIVKNIVEESIETFGYSLILIAAIELVFVCLKRKKQADLLVSDS